MITSRRKRWAAHVARLRKCRFERPREDIKMDDGEALCAVVDWFS
jgi:hypothetical protein